jgi:hypothetical protein
MPCPICKRNHPYSVAQATGVMARTPRLLGVLLSRASAAKLSKAPAPGKWSAREILCHLADCEWIFGVRYRKIAAEPGTPLPAFEQDTWAKKFSYSKIPVKSALATFSAMRDANVAMLKSLPPGAWKQSGAHPTYGKLTLKDIVLHIATHDANHLARLEELCPPKRAAGR